MTDNSHDQPGTGSSSTPEGQQPAPSNDGQPAPGEIPTDYAGTHERRSRGAFVRELVIVVVVALGLSFLVKTFVVQPFSIPSASMENTLVTGDRILVSKFTPQHSDLHRGDVVVFSRPKSWGVTSSSPSLIKRIAKDGLIGVGILPGGPDHLVKRLIGLPGDDVVCCNAQHQITINGTAITETYLPPGTKSDSGAASGVPPKFDLTVPAGKVWVLGDNRGESADSRYNDHGTDGRDGSVPIADITGQVVAIAWPISRIGALPNANSVFADIPKPKP